MRSSVNCHLPRADVTESPETCQNATVARNATGRSVSSRPDLVAQRCGLVCHSATHWLCQQSRIHNDSRSPDPVPHARLSRPCASARAKSHQAKKKSSQSARRFSVARFAPLRTNAPRAQTSRVKPSAHWRVPSPFFQVKLTGAPRQKRAYCLRSGRSTHSIHSPVGNRTNKRTWTSHIRFAMGEQASRFGRRSQEAKTLNDEGPSPERFKSQETPIQGK